MYGPSQTKMNLLQSDAIGPFDVPFDMISPAKVASEPLFSLTPPQHPSSSDAPVNSRQELLPSSPFDDHQVPTPTPLGTVGIKIVRSYSLQEIATPMDGDASVVLAALLLPSRERLGIDEPIEDGCLDASQGKMISLSHPDINKETCWTQAAPAKLDARSDVVSASATRPGQCHANSRIVPDPLPWPITEKWDMSFDQLREYKRRYGHCNVPYLWESNIPLSQWVKRQRHQKKLKDQGRHSNLTDDRERLLEGLGFCWDPRDAAWDERFEELCGFHRVHGHCRVTPSQDVSLSVWLKRQRHQSRLFLSGIKDGAGSTITEDRIRKLLDLGVDLNVRPVHRVAPRRFSPT
jgi:Helicase associated domain